MKASRTTPIALALLLGATGAGAALAQDYRGEDAEEVAALDRVKLSLADAITAAERETAGRALEAQLESENGRIFYQVDVFEGNGIKEVYIDTETGRVLDVVEDRD